MRNTSYNEFNDDELTDKEVHIARMVALGSSNKMIAAAYGIEHSTVTKHIQNIMDKLHVPNRAGIAEYALCQGYVSFEELSRLYNWQNLFRRKRKMNIAG
jgi:DNA-binding NarL/FixJ family response regulator